MTTVAAAGIRISKTIRYPPAKRSRNAGSKRPPRSAALAIHFMNFVSIVLLRVCLIPTRDRQTFRVQIAGAFHQARQPHCLRTLIRSRRVATSRTTPATKSSETATARNISVVFNGFIFVCQTRKTYALHVLTLGALCRARRSPAFVGLIETKPFLDMTRVRGHH